MPEVLVGVTSYYEHARWGNWDTQAALIPHWYLDLIHHVGADVVLIPPRSSDSVLDRLDGLLIAGGADVNPELYGDVAHETTDSPRVSRDETEIRLYQRAREISMPVLGVCRGLQIMAVAHGGSLHQHLPEVSTLAHKKPPFVFVNHEATLATESKIGEIYGQSSITVNSFHHQAVKDPGDLTVTGWASDGTIEVCENSDAVFAVGVQWHPEHPDRRELDRPLIEAFVRACVDRSRSV